MTAYNFSLLVKCNLLRTQTTQKMIKIPLTFVQWSNISTRCIDYIVTPEAIHIIKNVPFKQESKVHFNPLFQKLKSRSFMNAPFVDVQKSISISTGINKCIIIYNNILIAILPAAICELQIHWEEFSWRNRSEAIVWRHSESGTDSEAGFVDRSRLLDLLQMKSSMEN